MADIPEPEYSIRITARLLIMTAITNASSPLKICLESSSSFVFITILSSNTSKGLLSENIFCHTFLTADPCVFYILYFLKILFFIESGKFPTSTTDIFLTYSTVQTRIRFVLPGIPRGTPPANTIVSPTFTSLCFCAASIALRQRISELYSSLISIG